MGEGGPLRFYGGEGGGKVPQGRGTGEGNPRQSSFLRRGSFCVSANGPGSLRLRYTYRMPAWHAFPAGDPGSFAFPGPGAVLGSEQITRYRVVFGKRGRDGAPRVARNWATLSTQSYP